VRFAPAGSEVELSGEVGGDRIRIQVADRGPGIPEAERALIFDRFYQIKRSTPGVSARSYNVGLGLSIAKSIVDLHGGTISAQGRDGGGTCFWVELPTRSLALLVDATSTLIERVAPALTGRARIERAQDLDAAAEQAQVENPALVLVHGTDLATQVAAGIDRLSSASGRRPLLVEVTSGEVAATGAADRELALPVLDVEVYELIRELGGAPS
jgi:hypothetical protein